MKPLPDLNNIEAMAARGRRSSLMSARNEALEELRDTYTSLQSADIWEMAPIASHAKECCERLMEIAAHWEELR